MPVAGVEKLDDRNKSYHSSRRQRRDRMMLYGRQRERAVLAALLDRARRSHSGMLVLRGPPGIGKSALLEDVVSRAKRTQRIKGGSVAIN